VFDTVLYVSSDAASVSQLSCNDDTVGCAVGGTGSNSRQGSVVTLNVTAGQTYFVTVDGYSGSSNASQGQFVLTVTAP